MKMFPNILMPVFGFIVISAFSVWSVEPVSADSKTMESDNRTIAPYFMPSTSSPKAPDAEGFLQRWLLLEPINKPNRSNTVFTDRYIRNAFSTEYFANQFTVVPKAGAKGK